MRVWIRRVASSRQERGDHERRRPERPRVFCIGWHKTGTSSLGYALVQLGYSVLGCRLDMVHPLRKGDFDSVLSLPAQFDAVQDVPWAALYQELDQAFPGSRFIMTNREDQSWLRSALRHFESTDIPLHEWLYGEGVLRGNEELYLARYRRHNRDVLDYFAGRKSDLLVMNLENGDAWDKLCRFLDEDIPNAPFPHANKTAAKYSRRERFIAWIKNRTPQLLRRLIFKGRLMARRAAGKPDPRNVFNNVIENRRERQTWRSRDQTD